MIDTHLHILPGVDDGPDTVEESLALARVLVKEGVHSAIATPHYNDEFQHRSAREIAERVAQLQQALQQHNIPLHVFAGHEVLIKPGLVDDVQRGNIATLNGGRYLLLELWNNAWIPETEQVIFELRAMGIVPIIAHPERYRAIQQDQTRLATLIQRGVLAQITAGSLAGVQGNTARRCAEALLKRGLVHCIASDAHGLHKRKPHINEGLQCASKVLGKGGVHALIESIPAAIVNNETL